MATPFTGRYCAIQLGGTSTGRIDNLGHWEININFDELDASAFGSVWKKNMTGMQGWSGTVEGFFDPSTGTNTMMMSLLNASVDATVIQDIRFYLSTATSMFFIPNYTTFSVSNCHDTGAGAYISNARITADKNALVSASFNVLGYGPLVLLHTTTGYALVEGT